MFFLMSVVSIQHSNYCKYVASKMQISVKVLKYKISNQEAQLIVTNPRDVFKGQSRSANIVPFHRLGIVSYCTCTIVTLSFYRYFCNRAGHAF